MKLSAEELINTYIQYAVVEEQTKLSGDYKIGNQVAKKLQKIFEKLKQDDSLANDVIGSLLECTTERAKSLAAVDALRLGIFTDKAVSVLEEVSAKRQDIIGFGCTMALKIYRGEIAGRTLP